jgi:hypothetical protein
MVNYKAILPLLIGLTLAESGTAVAQKQAKDLPDPCKLVTEQEISDLLWQGVDAKQRDALQAQKAQHVFTTRVENVDNPAGRTCYFKYKRTAGGKVWSEGDFKLRTLARPTFDLFAMSSPKKQQPIPGVGDQAFYMSNAAYGRRGEVGIEIVEFNSKALEIELLKKAIARLK